MQSITPLTTNDFKGSTIVIGKIEIDVDGTGNYQELPDVQDFSVNTNIEDEVSRFCAYAFSITCLNTDKRYFSWNTSSSYYNWLKQGRRIKIYAGIKSSDTDYYYQWLIGRVDNYSLATVAGEEICYITGRDFMRTVLDYKLYSPNTYWGTSQTFDTVALQSDYAMNADCKGIYIAYLDNTDPYDGSKLYPIYEGSDFGYIETTNKFSFLAALIPTYDGTNNLVVYYFQAQKVEDAVADILLGAGIFADETAKNTWLANTDLITPTGVEIDRVSFYTGQQSFEGIRLLAEVVQYRFYFDYAGNPVFKPKPTIGTSVDTLSDDCITSQEVSEDVEEIYNNIIVVGETRETLG